MLKAAATLDGKIATASGDSKWITGERARRLVHRWRSRIDAIMIGKNTAKLDNPLLTTRLVKGKNPTRVVIDKDLWASGC